MSKKGSLSNKVFSGVFWLAVFAVVVFLMVKHLGIVGNVAITLIGFGSVILIHEFGHFIIAKIGGIKVEGFSIGMPPTLIGVQRTGRGIRFRILPMFFGGENPEDESDSDAEPEEGALSFTLGKGGKASDTEYRIGLIPFGGYVKLLGQEDVGPVKQIEDARSFANKPIRVRIPVIAAGVTFNIISAAIILMTVFLIGIDFAPPVVGGVIPDSPAAKAGLQAGDEIVAIDGDSDMLDFSSLALAAALSDRDQPIQMKVLRRDGQTDELALEAEQLPEGQMREFGILAPQSLTLAEITDPNALQERTGLLPGDTVTAVAGKSIERHWAFAEAVQENLVPSVPITAQRNSDAGESEQIHTELPMTWPAASGGDPNTDAKLDHVYSMVPRLAVMGFADDPEKDDQLRNGDVILAVGDLENPTYRELRQVTIEYEDRALPIQVLRADANGVEQEVTVTATPKRNAESDRVQIGFFPVLDAAHAVVATTISAEDGPEKLEVPRGATITTVNGKPVSSYYDIIAEVQRWDGQPVTLEYRLADRAEGGVTLQIAQAQHPIDVEPIPAEVLPFAPLERLYKAENPIGAIKMGYRKTKVFVVQTYITLKQLITGLLSPKLLMGPVGIVVSSYQIVEGRPLVYYAYFLGLISASIAVLNLMPMPPFDGGLIVLMLIEKIKGSALSEKSQGILAYTGWVLVLALLIYVTFNDILRTVRGFLS